MRGTVVLSLGLLAMTGGSLAIAPAAMAKDAAAAPQEAPLKPSAGFAKVAGPVQKLLQDKKFADAKAQLPALQAAATTPDDKYIAGRFALQVALNDNDATAERAAIEEVLASGKASAADLPKFYSFAGKLAYQAHDYPAAIDRLNHAVQLGYTQDATDQAYLAALFDGHQDAQAFAYARQVIAARRAAGQPIEDVWFAVPAEHARLAGNKDVMLDFLTGRLENSPTSDFWYNAIRVFLGQYDADRHVQLDALRLQAAVHVLRTPGEYAEYMNLASEQSLPGEVVRAYDAGVQSGVIHDGDPRFASVYAHQKIRATSDHAALAIAERDAHKSGNGIVARSTADGYMSFGEWAKAAELYELALTKGGVDANRVNADLGIARAMQGDAAGAKAAFAQTSGSMAALSRLWMVYVRSHGAQAAG